MPGVTLGYLRFVLGLDSLSFNKGTTDAEARIKSMQRSFENVGAKLAITGAAITGLTAPLIGFAREGIKQAQQTASAMAQVNAALTSMGPVAGRTAAQLNAAANAFEGSSLFEADDILKKVTANLLTFGNIAGANFDKAQQAAIDLSTRLGTDLQSSAILVGKALNDPVKGLTALGRAGIQFTASQKETIKAMVEGGNAAGAQSIILGELARQFGGAAQAAQNADPYNRLQDAMKNAAETIGTALLPLIPPLTNAIASVAEAFSNLSPQTQKWVLIIGGVAVAVGPVLVGFGAIVASVGALLPAIVAVGAAFATFAGIVTGAAVPAIVAAGVALSPILVPLAAVTAAVTGVYLAYRNWDKIKPIVQNMVEGVAAHLRGRLSQVLADTRSDIETVRGKFHELYDKVVGHSYIPDMVDGIALHIARLQPVMVVPVQNATKAAAAAFAELQAKVGSLLSELFPEAAATVEFRDKLGTINDALAKQFIHATQAAEAVRRLQAAYADRGVDVQANTGALDGGGVAQPLTMLNGGFKSLADVASQSGAIVAQALDGIPSMASAANDALRSVAQDGVRSLADGLVAVVSGTATLGQVFRQVAQQIISELLRIETQKLLMSFASSLGIPGLNLSGARAAGGPVSAGGAYLVGEKGPEIFTPGRSGRIIANDNIRAASAGRSAPAIHVYMPGGMNDREARQTGYQAGRAAARAYADSTRARG